MKKFISLILVLVITFSFSACSDYEPIEPTTPIPAVEMDLKTINEDMENNEINARETHLGKRYRIVAKVNRISEDYLGGYVNVSPLNIYGSYSVYLYYENNQDAFVRGISKDDIITFEGTLKTIHSGIHMEFKNVIFINKAE